MPLDPTCRSPRPVAAPIDLRIRLIVAALLFATAPVPSPETVEPTDPTDPAFRSSPFRSLSGRSAGSFLE